MADTVSRVSIRRPDGPVARPWIHETASNNLNGTYVVDPVDGDAFEVDLGGSQYELRLVLSYEEYDYLRPEGGEILSAALCYDPALDDAVTAAAAELFLGNSHFHRLPTQRNDEQ